MEVTHIADTTKLAQSPIADAGPDTLPILSIQPVPRFAILAQTPDGSYTALTRVLNKGDAVLCGLCPKGRCVAVEDVCTLQVPGKIEHHEALMYSTLGLSRVRG
jgi:hypothetical protein